MKTKRLAVDAVLSAMCAVLGAVAIDLNSIKITLESFPVLLGALLFGPVDGMAIGFVGTFLYQLLRCGFGPAKIYRLACRAFEGIYSKETIGKWLKTFCRRFFAQQFKRSCLPDGPKVGSVAVSPRGDLRMPSDASRMAWQKELDQLPG